MVIINMWNVTSHKGARHQEKQMAPYKKRHDNHTSKDKRCMNATWLTSWSGSGSMTEAIMSLWRLLRPAEKEKHDYDNCRDNS